MEHHHENTSKNIILRIILALLFFAAGFHIKFLFIIAYIIAGYDVILNAAKNIFNREFFDENFLMSIATLGAIYIHEYPEAAMVMILYKIGEHLQDCAVEKSVHSIQSLIEIRPDFAVINGTKIQPENVNIGDIITVKSGERIPLDGIVAEGCATVDNSALTGESVPVKISAGCEVFSGGINLDGILNIKVTKPASESTAQKILDLINNAADKKAKTEKYITKFAKIYTPCVVFLAVLITFLPHFFIAQIPISVWFERALTFLVISCPCALVISIPLGFFAGIGCASSNGILIKGGNYIEQISNLKTVVFDKTGTLTTGIFGVSEVHSENPDILKFAAIAEYGSSHPVANAIKKAYTQPLPNPKELKEHAGKGVEALYEDKVIKVGAADFTGAEPVKNDNTVIYVSVNNECIGHIVLSDKIKEDSEQTIKALNNSGIKTVMLTGDKSERAKKTQLESGIQEVYAELLPEEKVRMLEKIITETHGTVAFAGDGINDAPVIKQADVGFAMGGLGTDSAVEVADAVIMDDKPSKIITAIKISKKTMSIVKQNIIIAIGIKFLFLTLGAFGFITMWGAVFADVGVTLIAVLNSLRAKFYTKI